MRRALEVDWLSRIPPEGRIDSGPAESWNRDSHARVAESKPMTVAFALGLEVLKRPFLFVHGCDATNNSVIVLPASLPTEARKVWEDDFPFWEACIRFK